MRVLSDGSFYTGRREEKERNSKSRDPRKENTAVKHVSESLMRA